MAEVSFDSTTTYEGLQLPNISTKQINKEYKHQVLTYPTIKDSNTSKVLFNQEEETIDLIPTSMDKDNFDKIPLSILIFYSLPSFGKMSCLVLLNIHATLYYESIGTSLIYMSFFVTLARGMEIILKPFIAHWSDELRTRIGRRKPFMIIGCGFYALFLILLFTPPSMKTGRKNISIWFGAFYVLFFLAETVTIVPYLALGPELSTNSKQRERLYFFFYVFQYIGVLFAAASPVFLNRFFDNCNCTMCMNNPLIVDLDKCIRNCKIICSVKSNQTSLFTLSSFIGIYFVISIGLLSYKIQERSESFNTDLMEFIPSLYELISNKPFLSLISPWILDVTIITIFSTILPFFLNIIINPQKYCILNNIPLEKLECSVNYYLGLVISIFFICCIGFCSLWHYLVAKFGKRKCWQIHSLFCIIPFSIYFFCDLGTGKTLIFAGILTAFPASGIYLNDVLLSDTIEYDEFFSGKRNEGIYTVTSTFIPKFVSLFAQAIPLSLLSILGFIPSEDGFVQTQPWIVTVFVKSIFSIVPIIIAIISYLFKLKYPINNDGVMFQVKQGIDIQKDRIEYMRSAAYDFYILQDPVYKRKHINLIFESSESKQTKRLAEHFQNLESLTLIYNGKYDLIRGRMRFVILISFVLFVGGNICVVYTFNMLSDQKYSFIPISGVFLVSLCLITMIIYKIKYDVITEVIEGKIKVDKKILKLMIYQKFKNDKYSGSKENDTKTNKKTN